MTTEVEFLRDQGEKQTGPKLKKNDLQVDVQSFLCILTLFCVLSVNRLNSFLGRYQDEFPPPSSVSQVSCLIRCFVFMCHVVLL